MQGVNHFLPWWSPLSKGVRGGKDRMKKLVEGEPLGKNQQDETGGSDARQRKCAPGVPSGSPENLQANTSAFKKKKSNGQ